MRKCDSVLPIKSPPSGPGVGPGLGLNQFYSVYVSPAPGTSITVGNNGIGATNMISLVAGPAQTHAIIPEPMTMLAVALSLTGLGRYIHKRRRN